MNARVEAVSLRAPMLFPAARGFPRPTPSLVAAVNALSAYTLHETDATLEDLRTALEGTGFTWSERGQLTFTDERTALLDELGELVDTFGGRTPAALLFPTLGKIEAGRDELEALES